MAKSKKGNPDDSTIVERLAESIGLATKSSKFCVAGSLPLASPRIEVEGLGVLEFPLKPATVKKLVARCRQAPYGKGTETLVDTKVRKTFELDPASFRLDEAWNSTIARATQTAAEELGLPADRLEATLYKLLVYERGGFFLPHRDSEKQDRMVATLIVVLPHRFDGGTLIVRHAGIERTLSFEAAALGKNPCYAAFYADCEHEVERVTFGVRLCLAYNLSIRPEPGKSSPSPTASSGDPLAESLGTWIAKQPGKPLVFALDHHYTERGLSLDLLKGTDRQLADLVVAAAERADCLVHLAQVSRHLQQYADDGSFESSRSRYGRAPRRRSIEIGETYEDDLEGSDWADVDGKRQPWGSIGFDLSAIVASTPIDDWKPTSEEFEGYTGNAGNTLDRWYHRSAIVVWHRDHQFEVIASSGVAESIPLFHSMVAKLARTPKKGLEAARGECIRFAQALIARWPHRKNRYWQLSTLYKSFSHDDFPTDLLAIGDRGLVAAFLAKLAGLDDTLKLDAFVLDACREFGWDAFAAELKRLIARSKDAQPSTEIPPRDVEWLSAFCCDPTADAGRLELARDLCAMAVERFREPRPANVSYHARPTSSVTEITLLLLVKAVAAGGRAEDLSSLIEFVEQSTDVLRLEECQVPALKSLIPWSSERFGTVPPQLACWLASVRRRLEASTASKPTATKTWARPAKINCVCLDCTQLKEFLADPEGEIGRFRLREDLRQHLLSQINQSKCDVNHSLVQTTRPFTLVLKKTTGSFDRAVEQFERDCVLLADLPT